MSFESPKPSFTLGMPVICMETALPTRGQLERQLSQRIQALYRSELGHQPAKVFCQIFDEKVIIILEDSITKTEKLLAEKGQEELAEQVRSEIDEAIQPQVKQLIEEVLEANVIDLLSNAKLETGRTGTIVMLESPPKYRTKGVKKESD